MRHNAHQPAGILDEEELAQYEAECQARPEQHRHDGHHGNTLGTVKQFLGVAQRGSLVPQRERRERDSHARRSVVERVYGAVQPCDERSVQEPDGNRNRLGLGRSGNTA